MSRAVFRFAPSPNGLLHLGHAYSALLNQDLALKVDGRLLLRIEDIDIGRCTPEFEDRMKDDLRWLGIEWERPARRQSEHFDDYRSALDQLIDEGLVYPSFLSRGAARDFIATETERGKTWPVDPDGVPLFPVFERKMTRKETQQRIASGDAYSWRLNMDRAVAHIGHVPEWQETGSGPDGETGSVRNNPAAWGDVVIARKEIPTSYHLAVTVDDALQGITHVVRGMDLFHATAVQRLLQDVLGLPVPQYHHHQLVLDNDGRKLSKSRPGTSIKDLREAGMTPRDIRRMVGMD